MTRLSAVRREDLSADTRQILEALPDLRLFGVIARAESVLPSWLMMGGSLLTGLSISPQVRELVILQVAATTGCRYERVQHEAIARGVGVPDDQIAAVSNQRLDADCITDHRGMLESINRLVQTHSLTPGEYATLSSAFDERQLVEVLIVVGWYLAIALLAGAVDLDIDAAADMAVVDAANAHLGSTS